MTFIAKNHCKKGVFHAKTHRNFLLVCAGKHGDGIWAVGNKLKNGNDMHGFSRHGKG
jgi:hypothetical protein